MLFEFDYSANIDKLAFLEKHDHNIAGLIAAFCCVLGFGN